jgi:hypothetical protein
MSIGTIKKNGRSAMSIFRFSNLTGIDMNSKIDNVSQQEKYTKYLDYHLDDDFYLHVVFLSKKEKEDFLKKLLLVAEENVLDGQELKRALGEKISTLPELQYKSFAGVDFYTAEK